MSEEHSKKVLYGFAALLSLLLFFGITNIYIKDVIPKEYNNVLFVGEEENLDFELSLNKANVDEDTYKKIKDNADVVWEVNNPEIAIIENNTVKAIKEGDLTVKLTVNETFEKFYNIKIVIPLEDIVIEDIILNTYSKIGDVKYTLIPENAYIESFTMEIENEEIAKIDDNQIVANNCGETNIKIVANNIEKNAKVFVKKATDSITSKDITLIQGKGAQVTINPDPADAEVGLSYKYEIADESIASVSESGWISAKKGGKTTLIITNEFGQSCESSITVQGYPLTYSDATSNITIYREWYGNAYVYAAHITFSDYSRLGTACGRNVYGGTETTSSAAARQGAILCINGCYSAPRLNYPTARSGVLMQDGKCYSPGVYSKNNGLLLSAWESGGVPGYVGTMLSSLVASGAVTDTFTFGPPFLMGGSIRGSNGGGRAQRTFIGTNGNPGDIWLCVSDGRHNDGVSAGLTAYECAAYLQSKGCTLGIPLDGGGSSTMVFRGSVLNAAAGRQRSVVDFVYFR